MQKFLQVSYDLFIPHVYLYKKEEYVNINNVPIFGNVYCCSTVYSG